MFGLTVSRDDARPPGATVPTTPRPRRAIHGSDLEATREARRADRTQRPAGLRVRVPKRRKEPLTDAEHVRNAIARFDQVIDVSDAERAQAFENIKAAAQHYDVEMSESKWQELGRSPDD
jgi:hypothetical protein